ncbi:MAG: hypothetical protein Q9166_001605 [cf. Caloplaca sp. 2 TL-2023]
MSRQNQPCAPDSCDPVYSEGLLAIMLATLQDKLSPNGNTFYLTQIYKDYAVKMASCVTRKFFEDHKASVRVYEDIKYLREEIEVIKSVLTEQNETLCSLWSSLYSPDDVREDVSYDVRGEDKMRHSLSHRVVERMRNEIERRIEDFEELLDQADTIQYTAAQSISLKAETNNRAILIFTVVTIIFLPLTFVAGYFGMNARDIRDMSSGQSLFWAIGVPFTALILSCALLAAYFERIGRYLSRLLQRGEHEKSE